FVWLRLLLLTVVRVFVTHPPTTEIYTLSLHDALPIFARTAALDFGAVVANHARVVQLRHDDRGRCTGAVVAADGHRIEVRAAVRSEEHTSELQSRENLVCRLLLEKKKLRQRAQRRDLQ